MFASSHMLLIHCISAKLVKKAMFPLSGSHSGRRNSLAIHMISSVANCRWPTFRVFHGFLSVRGQHVTSIRTNICIIFLLLGRLETPFRAVLDPSNHCGRRLRNSISSRRVVTPFPARQTSRSCLPMLQVSQCLVAAKLDPCILKACHAKLCKVTIVTAYIHVHNVAR